MRSLRSPLALALAAAAALAPAAAAAPLSAGPSISLPRLAESDELLGAAVAPAGDALLVSSPQTSCCRTDQPLVARQRRGPRGAFAKPVKIVGVQTNRPYSEVASALAANGNALVAYIGPGDTLAAFRRKGWKGSWQAIPSPAGASPFSSPQVVVAPGGGFYILWNDAAGSVRSARLLGGAWQEQTALALPAADRGLRLALAPGGTALAVWSNPSSGQILAAARPSLAAPWGQPIPIGAVAPTPFSVPVSAAIGRDGSFLAGWFAAGVGGTEQHGWFARRRSAAPLWQPALDLGKAGAPPTAATNPAGNLAVTWPLDVPFSDTGTAPVRLVRQIGAAPPSGPIAVPTSGGPVPALDPQGGLTAWIRFGGNAASFGVTAVTQDHPGAPFKVSAPFKGRAWAAASSLHYGLLGASAPEEGSRVVYRGVDRLGPLGLAVPAIARKGALVRINVNLWKPTTVTVHLLGGAFRAPGARRYPAGRSTIALRLPTRRGNYVINAFGRERPKGPFLSQRAVIRVR